MLYPLFRTVALILLLLPGVAFGVSQPADMSTDALTRGETTTHRLAREIDTGIALLPVDEDETWLHIDLSTRKLHVFRGEEVIREYPYVAIGKNGAERIRFQGSLVTPTGTYKIERINPSSRFNTFLGINYPNPEVAREASESGLIPSDEAERIARYYKTYRRSLPDTSLGGNIGIHGLGSRDPFIHTKIDWTEGCIAITNQEIREISRLVDIGTQVVIELPQ